MRIAAVEVEAEQTEVGEPAAEQSVAGRVAQRTITMKEHNGTGETCFYKTLERDERDLLVGLVRVEFRP